MPLFNFGKKQPEPEVSWKQPASVIAWQKEKLTPQELEATVNECIKRKEADLFVHPLKDGNVARIAVTTEGTLEAHIIDRKGKVQDALSPDTIAQKISTHGGLSHDAYARIGKKGIEEVLYNAGKSPSGTFDDAIKGILTKIRNIPQPESLGELHIPFSKKEDVKSTIDVTFTYAGKDKWNISAKDPARNGQALGKDIVANAKTLAYQPNPLISEQVVQKAAFDLLRGAKAIISSLAQLMVENKNPEGHYAPAIFDGYKLLVSAQPKKEEYQISSEGNMLQRDVLQVSVRSENGFLLGSTNLNLKMLETPLEAQLLNEATSDGIGILGKQLLDSHSFMAMINDGVKKDDMVLDNHYVIGGKGKSFNPDEVYANVSKYPGAYRLYREDPLPGQTKPGIPVTVYYENNKPKVYNSVTLQPISIQSPEEYLSIASQLAPQEITEIRNADLNRVDYPEKVSLADIMRGQMINCMENGIIDGNKLTKAIQDIAAKENVTISMRQNSVTQDGNNKYAQLYVSPLGEIAMVQDNDFKHVKLIKPEELANMMPNEVFTIESFVEKVQNKAESMEARIESANLVAHMRLMTEKYASLEEPVKQLAEALQNKYVPDEAARSIPTKEGAYKIAEAMDKYNMQHDITDPANHEEMYQIVMNAMGENCTKQPGTQSLTPPNATICAGQMKKLFSDIRTLDAQTRNEAARGAK